MKQITRTGAILFAAFLLFFFFPGTSASSGLVEGTDGMVAAAHPLASKTGVEILRKGGNAVDAAVATAFAIGVVEPYASGVGGGGFLIIYLNKNRHVTAIDYRDKAPSGSPRSPPYARQGLRSVAIPGTVAGLVLALEKYGTMNLQEVIEPAARLAEDGFEVDALLSGMMRRHAQKFTRAARQNYLRNGRPYRKGERFQQKDLAKTLRLIGENGADAFYGGTIGQRLLKEMEKAGKWMSRNDLRRYRAEEKQPVRGDYRGYQVFSVPPPSSGLLVIQLLNILEGYEISKVRHNSAREIQLLAEAMRRVFVDRARFMGDPEFVKVPVDELLSEQYAARLRSSIEKDRASTRIERFDPRKGESDRTTHISVVDRHGNAVSLTQTLGEFFGSGIVIPGTGIMLNNQIGDFVGARGTPNAGAPGKRPMSSMSPTIVIKEGKPFLVVGGAGAMRIVSSITQIIINMVDYGMDVNAAISAPRVHAQSRTLTLESMIREGVRSELKRMGYRIDVRQGHNLFLGGAQGIAIDRKTGKLQGAADPRRQGSVAGY
jgi:gamma-glutamyltranspeptidase/glutathione hydrolase